MTAVALPMERVATYRGRGTAMPWTVTAPVPIGTRTTVHHPRLFDDTYQTVDPLQIVALHRGGTTALFDAPGNETLGTIVDLVDQNTLRASNMANRHASGTTAQTIAPVVREVLDCLSIAGALTLAHLTLLSDVERIGRAIVSSRPMSTALSIDHALFGLHEFRSGNRIFVGQTAAADAIVPGTMIQAEDTAHRLVSEIEDIANLEPGWDGEGASAPLRNSVDDAIAFARMPGVGESDLFTTADPEGRIMLEVPSDRVIAALTFPGDGTFILTIAGHQPRTVDLNDRAGCREVLETLAS